MTAEHAILSYLAAGLIAAMAWRMRSLNRSGALAATLLGGTITATAGWAAGALLITFFITSSLLSKVTSKLRPKQGSEVARGSNRDARQVLANGGVAMLCAIAWWISKHDWILAAFAASLATAASDTWATEIGAFSKTRPRLITTFKPVERGVSGAVSSLGTLATIAGATCIAAVATVLLDFTIAGSIWLFAAIAAAGILGSLIDSVLGATVQVHFLCPTCNQLTERQIHRCGTPTVYARGVAFFTNDTVNLAAILAGTSIGGLLVALGAT